MALIKCPECGKMFSEYAECCPECGCPVEDATVANKEIESIPQQNNEFEEKTVSNKVTNSLNGECTANNHLRGNQTKPSNDSPTEDVVYSDDNDSKEKKILVLLAAIILGVLFLLGVSYYFKTKTSVYNDKTSITKELALSISKYGVRTSRVVNNNIGFSDGLLSIQTVNGYGYIDKKGNEVIPPIYKYATEFSEGLAYVEANDWRGYINTEGKHVVTCPPSCDYGYPFNEGFAIIEISGKFIEKAIINKEGIITYPPKSVEIEGCRISDGLIKIKEYKDDGVGRSFLNCKSGMIDTRGQLIIPCQYDDIHPFSEGLAAIENSDGKWGFINKNNKIVIPCIYKSAESFSNGIAYVTNDNNERCLINSNGKITSSLGNYSLLHGFSEGMGGVCELKDDNLLYGFIDETGKVVIPCIYDYAVNFSEGLAVVRRDNKYGFVNKSGEEVIPCKYSSASSFSEGFAIVVDDKRHLGIINKEGECTLDMVVETNQTEEDKYLISTAKNIVNEIPNRLWFDDGRESTIEGTWGLGNVFIVEKEENKAVICALYQSSCEIIPHKLVIIKEYDKWVLDEFDEKKVKLLKDIKIVGDNIELESLSESEQTLTNFETYEDVANYLKDKTFISDDGTSVVFSESSKSFRIYDGHKIEYFPYHFEGVTSTKNATFIILDQRFNIQHRLYVDLERKSVSSLGIVFRESK